VIGAWGDLDVNSAARTGEGVMIERVLDGGEDGEVLVAGVGVRGGGVDMDVDVLCMDGKGGGEE
jgi:hypothetical protein